MQIKRAIVLCSGGLDSVTTAFYVKTILKYGEIIILFFNYGQRALKLERKYSKNCAKDINAKFIEMKMDSLKAISESLINKKGAIKKFTRKELNNTRKESEKFYVHCRNTIFLVSALALAESIYMKKKEKYDLFVGFKCEGKESYPDTTKEFVQEINRLSKISTFGFRILSPLIDKDKEDIIILAKKIGVDLKNTVSCYSPIKGRHCGFCLACMLRKEGFYWANIKDNTNYVAR